MYLSHRPNCQTISSKQAVKYSIYSCAKEAAQLCLKFLVFLRFVPSFNLSQLLFDFLSVSTLISASSASFHFLFFPQHLLPYQYHRFSPLPTLVSLQICLLWKQCKKTIGRMNVPLHYPNNARANIHLTLARKTTQVEL